MIKSYYERKPKNRAVFNTQDWPPPEEHLQTKLCWEEYLLTSFQVMILAITVPHMTAQAGTGHTRSDQVTKTQSPTLHLAWSPHLWRIKAMSPLYHGVCKVIYSSWWPNWCQCRCWHSSRPFGDGEHYAFVPIPQGLYLMLSWPVWKHSTDSGRSSTGWQHSCPHNSHLCRDLWMSPSPSSSWHRH